MPSLTKPDLPPEIADAIEFTPEFREAMGFFEINPESDAITRVPSKRDPEVDAERRTDAR